MADINIALIIGGNAAFTPSSGEKVYNEIIAHLKAKQISVLDFQGISLITTAFLNAAIGKLYKDYKSEELNEYLSLRNLSADDIARWRLVVETAKEYYANPSKFDQGTQDLFEG